MEIQQNIIDRIPEDGLDRHGRIQVPAAFRFDQALAAYWLSRSADFDLKLGKTIFRRGSHAERHNRTLGVVPARGSLLVFRSFSNVISFFTSGLGASGTPAELAAFTFLVVTYADHPDHGPTGYQTLEAQGVSLAWEAFELLARHHTRFRIAHFQLRIEMSLGSSLDLNSPGMWSLLKLREVPRFYIVCRRGVVTGDARKAIRGRLSWPKEKGWQPVGGEKIRRDDDVDGWLRRVRCLPNQTLRESQFLFLDHEYQQRQSQVAIHARKKRASQYRAQRRPQVRRRARVSPPDARRLLEEDEEEGDLELDDDA